PCPTRPPPLSTLSPYTTLFRSIAAPVPVLVVTVGNVQGGAQEGDAGEHLLGEDRVAGDDLPFVVGELAGFEQDPVRDRHFADVVDRKSTRLNSSHLVISYAVFC